jgi:surface antigen
VYPIANVPDGIAGTNTSPTGASTTLAVLGSTDVPLVAGSYCGFTPANPYPCCQNSPGQYGNCTGAAWEVAKARWNHQLPSWGNANRWADAARSAGYIVDVAPTAMSIGVNSVYPGHVGYITSVSGSNVTNYDQQCGAGYSGGYLSKTRPASYFNGGFIRAPIPTVNLLIWNGANQATNGGTLTVRRGPLGGPIKVDFGFGLLRSNVNAGSSSFVWTINGAVVSTAGTFSYTFNKAGSFAISSRVTNALGVSTTSSANVTIM